MSDSFPRWLIVSLVFVIIVLIAVGGWFYVTEEQQFRQNTEEDLQSIAQLKVNQIAEWRAEKLRDAAVIMESPFLSEAVNQWLANPQDDLARELLDRFRSLRNQFHYINVMLVDFKGQIRLNLDSLTGSLHETAARGLERAIRKKQPVLTDLHVGPGDIPPHIDVIAPLFVMHGKKKQPNAAVIFQINAARFLYPLVQFWPTPSKTAETLLIRRDGDFALFLNELRHRKNTALKLRIPLSEKNVPAIMAIEGKEGVVHGTDYRGVEVLAVLKPIPKSSWYMIAKIDSAEALAVWESRSFFIVALLVAVMISFITVAGSLWQRNSKIGYKKLYQTEASLRKAEERHRVTLLSVGDGVIVTDPQGRVELMNQVAENLTGWKYAEACGKPLDEVFLIVNEESRQLVENPVNKVMREGLVVGLANHTILIAKDGTEHPIADSGAPIRDEDGLISGVVLVFRDQSQERAAQKLLLGETEKARQYLDLAGTMLIGLDSSGNITLINRKGCEVLGYREQEILGKNWFENFLPNGSVNGVRNVFLDIVANSLDMHKYVENFVQTKNGDVRLIAWYNSVLRDEDGSIVGTLSSGEDITDQRKAEEVLRESESRYRATFDNASVGIDLVDREGRFLEVNSAFATFLGYTPQELYNFSILDLTHPDDLSKSRDMLEALIRGEFETYRLEKRYIRKDSTVLWADISVSAIRDEAGEHQATVGVIVDITQRKESEAANLRLATAVEHAAETIEITDAQGIIQYVNPAYERATGYSREDAIGNSPSILKSGDQDDKFYKDLWQTISEGRVWTGRFMNKKKDGSMFQEDVSISPVKNEWGDIVNYVAIKRDITQELLLEKQLQQAQKLESIAALAGGIAHDFNNLLTIASGYNEILLQDKDKGDLGYEELKAIEHAMSRGAELVKRILSFSRQMETHPRVLDLNEELRHVEKLLKRTIPKMIDVKLDLADNLHPVHADPGQIEQVILNLSINARDAMPEGGKLVLSTRNVKLDEEYCRTHLGVQKGEYVMLEVSDSGEGMDSQTLERVFEPFYSTKQPGEGTGLGLAMVFGIVKAHNGHINCYSEPGVGTSFKIYLPIVEKNAIDEDVSSSRQIPTFGTETIVLIDDEELIRSLGAKMLEDAGYRVLTASNGYEGLEIYRKHQEDVELILLDMIMPEMGGAQCLQELFNINPQVKVVITSGFSHQGQIKAALESGARGYVNKPFKRTDILTVIRKVLDEK